ncbi:hypothetical protein Syun_001681 [Stephania yunnanensis]|uniref:tRNA/rRNA methyltransferase SpoU type domain-containing protein n=1 Tax=Stephania yunnanensis TaxID=152371 RepID=A0AAP0QB54_9MAGN
MLNHFFSIQWSSIGNRAPAGDLAPFPIVPDRRCPYRRACSVFPPQSSRHPFSLLNSRLAAFVLRSAMSTHFQCLDPCRSCQHGYSGIKCRVLNFSYRRGDWLVFGSETSGLRPEILSDCNNESFGGGTMRIPMVETYVRCLNLSVSVGIAVYEASRQLNYELIQLE